MFFTNAKIFGTDCQFHTGSFEVKEGRFANVLADSVPADAVDLRGALVLPGLVDIHIHGSSGADVSDGTLEAVEAMSSFLVTQGVTSFVATTMTLPMDHLAECAKNVGQFMEDAPGARVLGMRMEGPILSLEKCGAQNPAYLMQPDWDKLRPLLETGVVKVLDIAPELPNVLESISLASRDCLVSLGHTNCSYEQAKEGFAAGARHITHLYNAMPALHHRKPGLIAAASETQGVSAEIICDGYHSHPAMVRLAFQMFPRENLCLVSDAGRCCGLEEGSHFFLGGQECVLSGGVGRLLDGTISCSGSTLMDCLRKAVAFGIPMEKAVAAATVIPANLVRRQDLGRIADGALADFLVCDEDLNLQHVFLGGKEIQ